MRDKDFRREYLGQWPQYHDHPENGRYKDEYITIRLIDKIDDCGYCPCSIACVARTPLTTLRMGPGFLCSRCACFHLWWSEERTHIVCGLLRFATHVSSEQQTASGIDHALVALYGRHADQSAHCHESLDQYDIPCANPWNERDLMVPTHPCGDGHPRYNRNEPRRYYGQTVDDYDCLTYFTGHAPYDFEARGISVIEPLSPFQTRQSIGDKIGTHGRRRLRGLRGRFSL